MKRSEIYEKINGILGSDYSKDDVERYTKNHLGEDDSLSELFLEKSYERAIEKGKEKINFIDKVNSENIEQVLLFASFALKKSEKKIEESVLDKDIQIFPNLKKVIILYSKETKELFNKLEKDPKYQDLKFVGVEIDKPTVLILSSKMKEVLEEEGAKPENTIIDMTLGMKVTSIASYKVALETGIAGYVWTELQPNGYKKKGEDDYEEEDRMKRIPLSTIDILVEPYKDNLEIYEYIEDSIKRYDFKETASLYCQLGNASLETFYEELSKVFSFEIFFEGEIDSFFDAMNDFIKELGKKIKNSYFKSTNIEKFINQIIKILYYIGQINDDSEIYKKISKICRIEEDSILEVYEEGEEEISLEDLKERLFLFLKVQYFQGKYDTKEGKNSYLYKAAKEIENDFGIKIKEKNHIEKFNRELLQNLVFLIEETMDEMNPIKALLEKNKKGVYYENEILYITKYDFRMDTSKEKTIKLGKNKGFGIIKELLSKERDSIYGEDVVSLLVGYYDKEDDIKILNKRIKTPLSRAKEDVRKFNAAVKKISREQGIPLEEDIICYEQTKSNKSTIYRHKFFINRAILE